MFTKYENDTTEPKNPKMTSSCVDILELALSGYLKSRMAI